MTAINKKVEREGPILRAKGRPIIVSIEPGGMLGFRLKGERTTYRVTIEDVYWYAARIHAQGKR